MTWGVQATQIVLITSCPQGQIPRDYRLCRCIWICCWPSFGWLPGTEGVLEGTLLALPEQSFSSHLYQWCFWMTIPVSALATGIVLFILPLKPVRGDIKRRLLVVDYLGSVLTLCGVTLVLLPLIWVRDSAYQLFQLHPNTCN